MIHPMQNHLWIPKTSPSKRARNPLRRCGMSNRASHAFHYLLVHLLIAISPRLSTPIQAMSSMNGRDSSPLGVCSAMILDNMCFFRVANHLDPKLGKVFDFGFCNPPNPAIICVGWNADIVRGDVDFDCFHFGFASNNSMLFLLDSCYPLEVLFQNCTSRTTNP